MTQASGARDDQAEAGETQVRGWFQPLSRAAATGAGDPGGPGSSASDDADHACADMGNGPAEASQTQVSAPPVDIGGSEDTSAAEPATPKTRPADRPADITRPQLILDDTVVDMVALRGGSDSHGGTSPAHISKPSPADIGKPSAGKPARRAARFSVPNLLRGLTC